MKRKVLIFGIDGGCFQSLQPWLGNGSMPFMNHFLADNFSNDILCEIDMAPGWPTFSTGKHPRNHMGYYWMGRNNKAKNDNFIINSDFFGQETLWHVLSQNNIKTALINVPFTYPPIKINGLVISGPGGGLKYDTGLKITHPNNLMNELISSGISYRMKWHDANSMKGAISYIKRINIATKSHIDAAKYISNKYDPDLLMIVFRGHDAIQHRAASLIQSGNVNNYSKLKAEIEQYYRLIDLGMKNLYEQVQNDNLMTMIASDHGFAPCHLKVNIDQLFKEKNWLKFNYSPLFFKALRKIKIKTDRANKSYINRYKTSVYRDSTNSISLNVKNRDHYGIINENEYCAFKEEIITFLRELTFKKYGKIFRKVKSLDQNDINTKFIKYEKYFPDIVFSPSDGIYVDGGFRPRSIKEYDKTFIELDNNSFSNWTGIHREFGLFAINCPKRLSENLQNVTLMDLAPSILDFFQVQIPSWVDGNSFVNK